MTDLNFEKADYGADGTPPCANCHNPRGSGYYLLGQSSYCARCQAGVDAYWATPISPVGYMRAIGAGLGAGIGGAALWAAVSVFLHVQLGIVAIAVGMAVGYAMRWGAGRGGLVLQILSVVITYVAIVEATVVGELAESGATVSDWVFSVALAPGLVPWAIVQEGVGGALWFVIVAIALSAAWRRLAHPALPWVGPNP